MGCIVPGILQARVQKQVAFPFSSRSSQPRNQTQVSHIAADSLPAELQGKSEDAGVGSLSLLQRIFPTQESNRDLKHEIYLLTHFEAHNPVSLTTSTTLCGRSLELFPLE